MKRSSHLCNRLHRYFCMDDMVEDLPNDVVLSPNLCNRLYRLAMAKQKKNIPAKRATLLSISRKAGVSTSTVSRALRGDSRISDATQSKLQQMARSEGYTPNAMARSLSTRRSNVIGLALGDLHNP